MLLALPGAPRELVRPKVIESGRLSLSNPIEHYTLVLSLTQLFFWVWGAKAEATGWWGQKFVH